jgi:hypothetical protein
MNDHDILYHLPFHASSLVMTTTHSERAPDCVHSFGIVCHDMGRMGRDKDETNHK